MTTFARSTLDAVKGSLHSALTALEESDADRVLVRLAKKCLSPERDDRPANAVRSRERDVRVSANRLQRVESDMNRFFQLSLDLFCIAGLDGYFRRINANFSRVLGHTEEDVVVTSVFGFRS